MHIATRLFSTIAFMFAMVSCYEVQNDEPIGETTAMALDTNFIPQTPDPNSLVPGNAASKVYEVKSNTPTGKNDIDFNNTVIERQIFTLADEKVNVAGDTMTDTLTITPTLMNPALVLNAGTNTTAAAINGNGSAAAVTITAGASNGAIVASANNSAYTIGVSNAGAGGGLSIQAGSTALNVSLNSAPVATAPSYGAQILGGLILIGTPPNADVNPGTNGFVASQNIVTSSAILTSDGSGGFAVVGNVGFNVASWSGNSSGVATVTFARNLPGNGYRRHLDAYNGFDARPNGVQNVGNYQFVVKLEGTSTTVDLTTTAVTIEVSTIGY
jgi:hypothetical protein